MQAFGHADGGFEDIVLDGPHGLIDEFADRYSPVGFGRDNNFLFCCAGLMIVRAAILPHPIVRDQKA